MRSHSISRRSFLATSAALAAYPFTNSFAQSSYGIFGEVAPELNIDYWIDENGHPTEYSVTDQKGKWVFLKCFQDWCPGCHSSGFPALQKFSAEFAGHPKVSIAAIQTVFEGFRSNTLEDVRKLQLRYELPIPMAHDPGNPDGNHRPQTMQKYRTGGTPWIIIIDPNGTVVFNDFHINVDKLIEYVAADIT